MELSLKDAVDIIDTIKTLDWYSVWIWLSVAIPFYYIALRKIIPDKKEENINSTSAVQSDVQGSLPLRTRILATFSRFFSLPRLDPFILFICLTLFTAGTFILLISQHEKERIRKVGWTLKNYMANEHFYRMSLNEVRRVTGINNDDLFSIKDQYPNEYVIVYSNCDSAKSISPPSGKIFSDSSAVQSTSKISRIQDSTIIMVDSLRKKAILDFSKKQLAAYLNNNAFLPRNGIMDFDYLFSVNNIFTNDAINQLIIDSNDRYVFNFDAQNRKAIVKIK